MLDDKIFKSENSSKGKVQIRRVFYPLTGLNTYLTPQEMVYLEKIEPYLIYHENSQLKRSASLKKFEKNSIPEKLKIKLPLW